MFYTGTTTCSVNGVLCIYLYFIQDRDAILETSSSSSVQATMTTKTMAIFCIMRIVFHNIPESNCYGAVTSFTFYHIVLLSVTSTQL